MFSFISVSASCSFLKYLGTVQERCHKEKRGFFFYLGTDSFKIRNMDKRSADYTDTDISASPSGASFPAGRGERLVMNRRTGPWEGYRWQGEARCLLPAFLCAHIFVEREASGYEAADMRCIC